MVVDRVLFRNDAWFFVIGGIVGNGGVFVVDASNGFWILENPFTNVLLYSLVSAAHFKKSGKNDLLESA